MSDSQVNAQARIIEELQQQLVALQQQMVARLPLPALAPPAPAPPAPALPAPAPPVPASAPLRVGNVRQAAATGGVNVAGLTNSTVVVNVVNDPVYVSAGRGPSRKRKRARAGEDGGDGDSLAGGGVGGVAKDRVLNFQQCIREQYKPPKGPLRDCIGMVWKAIDEDCIEMARQGVLSVCDFAYNINISFNISVTPTHHHHHPHLYHICVCVSPLTALARVSVTSRGSTSRRS